ncbi:MAG: hypothetical protein KQI81_08930 [Deltaproteobacteria bacterium]|nr:hypothetical protein [Deltaproteobacteria bacterium]
MGILTEADQRLLPLALRENGGFHLAAEWYLRGWSPLWYQFYFHQAPQPNVVFVAGIASGKTTSVAASNIIDCLTIPYFRALNTSVTAKQAELPFEMAMGWIEGNPRLEHLIDDISLRPFPLIKFKNFSEYLFRTAGKDARFIRGQEFDRINFDECGLEPYGETVKVLRGRLRGNRVDGMPRMNRMDNTSSPTGVQWFRERFERGWHENPNANLEDYLSMRISTYMNTRLSKKTIELMEAEYSDEMIDVELRGMFPEYGMSMFPRSHVTACFDIGLNDAAEMALRPESGKPLPGYVVEEHPRHGITKFELPWEAGHQYILGGDPGTDGPPKRNAGVIFALDATTYPRKVVYFDWVDGRGSYNPFLTSYKYAIRKYHPIYKGMDTTGTQKAIDELAFENHGISIDSINFNRDKDAALNTLQMMISNHELTMPMIRGLERQILSYSREAERDHKLAQDIVMALAITALLSRYVPDEYRDNRKMSSEAGPRNRRARTTRNARR